MRSLKPATTFFNIALPNADDLIIQWFKLLEQYETHANFPKFLHLWKSGWDDTNQYDIVIKLFSLSHAASPCVTEFIAKCLPNCIKNSVFTDQMFSLLISSPRSSTLNEVFRQSIPDIKKRDQDVALSSLYPVISKSVENWLLELQCRFASADAPPADRDRDVMTFSRTAAKWIEYHISNKGGTRSLRLMCCVNDTSPSMPSSVC
jgi:hypothetical protein